MLPPSHTRTHCSTTCMDRLQNQAQHYRTHVSKKTSETETSLNGGGGGERHLQDKIHTWFCNPASSQQWRKCLNFPLTSQTDRRCFHPASWFLFKCTMQEAKSTAVARLPCYDLSRLCREPVCGRQLSLKLVTVQPPTCQLNGVFICLRAMHYGREQSLLMALCLHHSSLTHIKKTV